MKKIILILVVLWGISVESQARSFDLSNEAATDSVWLHWFSNQYDNNVEICEMRNEYLFCRLESAECCKFLSYLSVSLNGLTESKIEKELQNPINDNINVKKCLQNVSDCSNIGTNFKQWLIENLRK